MAKKRSKSRFQYKPRSKESVEKRASQQGGQFDNWTKDTIPMFTPKAGKHRVRFLPPMWDGAEHYGMDIYVHFNVGPDQQQYLCLRQHADSKCPLCEESERLKNAGEDDAAYDLKANKRVLGYVIDRDDEEAGPKLWAMPWTVDRDITALMVDPDSGEVILVDHPDEGYDIVFQRQGTGVNTKYVGAQIARKSSPLCDDPEVQDEWLEFVQNTPVPKTLCTFDYDYVKNELEGGGPLDSDDDEEEKRGKSTKRRKKVEDDEEEDDPPFDADDDDDEEEEEEKPRRRRRVKKEEPEEEEEDDDDGEEEEEEKPRRRRRVKKEEPEEEDDDDDEEEEEEKPRRRSRFKKRG